MGRTHLLDFFEKMRFYFLNGRERTRQRATELVFELFSRYHGLQVDMEEMNSLVAFFLVKLLDVATVLPTARLLLELLKNTIRHSANAKNDQN